MRYYISDFAGSVGRGLCGPCSVKLAGLWRTSSSQERAAACLFPIASLRVSQVCVLAHRFFAPAQGCALALHSEVFYSIQV